MRAVASAMPYTSLSLTIVWLIALTVFVLAGSGVAGWWLVVLLSIAFAAPALLRVKD